MITQDTQVVGVGPRISSAAFASVLQNAGSPAASEAAASYDAIVAEGVDPLFALAVFHHESGFATNPAAIVVLYATKNPGNTRTSRTGVYSGSVTTPRGVFMTYATWTDGWRDIARRLSDPTFLYAQEGATTPGTIIPIYAPKADSNDPVAYIAAVISDMNQWQDLGATMQKRVALSAGHHNSDGGNATEYAITGPLTKHYADALRALGVDVRVVTPNDGLGQYPGGLQDVAQVVVDWANAGWVADVYLEPHTDAGGTDARGCSAIYPDWDSDVDVDVRDKLGPSICSAISAATGIPVNNPAMSEKSSAVGAGGFRLGIFLLTVPIAATTTRLIVEHGFHTSPVDLPILQSDDGQRKIAEASAGAIIAFLGAAPPPPPDERGEFPTGKILRKGNGFRNQWDAIGGLGNASNWRLLGNPVTDEYIMRFRAEPNKDRTVQLFEKGALTWDGSQQPPWDITAPTLAQIAEAVAEADRRGIRYLP